MEAVIALGPSKYTHAFDFKIPDLNSDLDILVKVECVGICASDGKMFKGADLFWNPVTGRA